jgi:hypothetical protein
MPTILKPIGAPLATGSGSLLDADLLDTFDSTTLPVSTPQQTALDLKAPKAAPTFTGKASFSEDIVVPKTSGKGIQVDLAAPSYGWRDIIGAVNPKASGAGSPSRIIYNGGVSGEYAFAANDVCDFIFHIPHDYVPGTDIYFHVHWSHTGTAISGNAVFSIYHMYAKGHNQANFPAEKLIPVTYATTDIATTPRYRHRIDEVVMSGATATATLMNRNDLEVDGVVKGALRLTTLPSITGGSLFIHTMDLHYQSTNMATKQKSPSFYV